MAIFDVKQFGATGDGTHLDRTAFQQALDRCASEGGGTVAVPAGTYLTGSLEMKSNTCLRLDAGAVLKVACDPALYPEATGDDPKSANAERRAVIVAEGAENIAIVGEGAIEGGGYDKVGNMPELDAFRPRMVLFRDCRYIQLRDIRLLYPNSWTIHLKDCSDIQIRGITIHACMDRINTDGIDPDGCRNLTISDCNMKTGDDCIVIKSLDGRPCENITVTNCVLSSRCSALKLGTESFGDMRNITFTNCVVYDTEIGIAFFNKDGGVFENVFFNNLVMEANRDFPVLFDITPRYYSTSDAGDIRNITLENVLITGRGRFLAEGRPGHPVRNLALRNVTWNVTDACPMENAVKPGGCSERKREADPSWINHASQPYQFVMACVEDVEMTNVKLYDCSESRDQRRGFLYAYDADRVRVRDVLPLRPPEGTEPVRGQNVRHLEVPDDL